MNDNMSQYEIENTLKSITQQKTMVKLLLDPQCWDRKPYKHEIGAISSRIVNFAEDISVENLAALITQPYGQTWIPSYFTADENGKRTRTNGSWAGQTLFALDFDSGISFDAVVERCKRYRIMPAFIYSTFSSENNNKFRVVFRNSFEINDLRLRNVIQLSLMELFDEADKNCNDQARMFFGGKEIIYHDYDAVIDIAQLVKSLCEFLTLADSKNYVTNIRRFCGKIGVDLKNNFPFIEVVASNDETTEPFCKEVDASLYYYRHAMQPLQNCTERNGWERVVIHFNPQATKTIFAQSPQRKSLKFDVVNYKSERTLIERVNYHEMEVKCQLYKEFISGAYWAYHNQIFGLATNLMVMSGGKKRFLIGVKNSPDYYNYDEWEFTAKYINHMDYCPQNCENFCPFAKTCSHGKNIVEIVKLRKGIVNILKKPEPISLQEAEIKLKTVFDMVLAQDDSKVYVIKAPTGIGKTELYLNLKNVTVAVPTHELKYEVSKRMCALDNAHILAPELPKLDPIVQQKLDGLYEMGLYSAASRMINDLAKTNYDLQKYIADVEALKTYVGTDIVTHDRLLITPRENKTVIIDEDIFTHLFKIGEVSISDLWAVQNSSDRKLLPYSLLEEVSKIKVGDVASMLWIHKKLISDDIEKLLMELPNISTNIQGFLKCSYWVKTSKDQIAFITSRSKNNLQDKKVIVLSATANELIYKQLFGERLVFIDLGYVQAAGEVCQYPQWSTSRSQFENKPDVLRLAKMIAKDKTVISFKRCKEEFSCFANHFGNVAGLDKYSGKDVAVIGTPHLSSNMYLLYAAALGIGVKNTTMKNTIVERNGMEYWFFTFTDLVLRELQQHFIESELQQAIGRARILRKKCTVTVISNLPVIGAEFAYLSQEEIDNLLERGCDIACVS